MTFARLFLALLLLLNGAPAWGQANGGSAAYGPAQSPYDLPTGATTSQSRANRFAQVLDVLDYGAKCDGSTDDTTAINAVFTQVRTLLAVNLNAAILVRFPTSIPNGAGGLTLRRCVTTGSINATGIFSSVGNVLQVTVDMQGSQIFSEVSAAPIIDALGSNQIKWRNLHAITDGTHVANYGIQIGRLNATVSDYGGGAGMKFEYPEIVGAFSGSAYYNFAGEEVHLIAPVFINTNSNAASHAWIDDGYNHFNITSAFQTQNAPVDTAQSFEETTVTGGSIQGDGAAMVSPLWIGGAHQHYFDNVYIYGATGATSCVEIYNESNGIYGGTKDLRLNTHCEGTALATKVLLDGTLTAPDIRDLWLHEPYEFASTALFGLGGSATTAVLEHPTISISGGPSSPAFVFASNPNPFSILSGDLYFYNASIWNVTGTNSGPSVFSGRVTIPGNGQGIESSPQTCVGSGQITTSGLANSRNWMSTGGCFYSIYGETSGATAVEFTSDGSGTPNANNCVNLPQPFGSQGNITIWAQARDRSTTSNWAIWPAWTGAFGSPSNASTTALTMDSLGSLTSGRFGGNGNTTTLAAAADTTNGCLKLQFTAPSGNTDLWDFAAVVFLPQVR